MENPAHVVPQRRGIQVDSSRLDKGCGTAASQAEFFRDSGTDSKGSRVGITARESLYARVLNHKF